MATEERPQPAADEDPAKAAHDAKLAELKARLARVQPKADARRVEAERARELHREEGKVLAAEMAADGEEGVDFNVVDVFPCGFFVVKLCDRSRALHKVFTSIPEGKVSPEHLDALVTPHLVKPSVDEFRSHCLKVPGIVWRAAKAVLDLCEGRSEDHRGKY